MTSKKRFITLFLSAMVVFVMIFSFLVIAAEAGHSCIGDNCPVCRLVALLEDNLRAVSFVLAVIALAFAAVIIVARLSIAMADSVELCTPVTLKVKMTN